MMEKQVLSSRQFSFLTILFLFLSFFQYGCKKHSDEQQPKPVPPISVSVNGIVDTSEIGGTTLYVESFFKQNCRVSNNSYSTTVSNKGTQLLFVVDQNNALRAMTLSLISNNNPVILEANALSTSYSLIFITPGISSTNPDSTSQRINRLGSLSSFQSLVSFLKNNLLNCTLNSLLENNQLTSLINNVVIDYAKIDTLKKGKGYDNDKWFWVTKISGTNYQLDNYNWRFISVYRRDLSLNGNELSTHPIWRYLSGGSPYSFGTILQMISNNWKPIPTEIIDSSAISPVACKSEYWVVGPGCAPAITPPNSINKDDLVEWCATGLFDVILPLIDIISGGTELLGSPLTLAPKIVACAESLSNELSIINSYNAINSSSLTDLLSSMTDFILAVWGKAISAGASSILVSKGIISATAGASLSDLLSLIVVGMSSSNLIISAKLIWDTPKFSNYEVFTRIPLLITPENNSNVGTLTPTLQWQVPNNFQSVYKVQVSLSSSFANNIVDIGGVIQPSYEIPENKLTINNTYYWRIKSEYEGGSAWSEYWSFMTGNSNLPVLTTLAVTNVTQTSANSGGNITTPGSSSVIMRGVCWSTSQNPSTSGPHSTDGMGIGSFTSNIIGLNPNTLYYVRAYATNSYGTAYANTIAFTTVGSGGAPCPGNPTITYEGKVYNTVQIGSQCWLKENLDVGIMINSYQSQLGNGIMEKYCYNNDPSKCSTFGGLYQWNEMMQYTATSGAKGICPTGWHLPTEEEWCLLESSLDTTVNCYISGFTGMNVGGKMKEGGTSHWNSPNTGATNSSGFLGLPGGARDYIGNTGGSGEGGFWWSSNDSDPSNAFYRKLGFDNAGIERNTTSKSYGFSVRCIKD